MASAAVIAADAQRKAGIQPSGARQRPVLLTCDADGRLIGLITPENIGEMTMIMAARGG